MPTQGQAISFHTNINSYLALICVASVALGIGLIIWHASVGDNPIADFLAQTSIVQAALQ